MDTFWRHVNALPLPQRMLLAALPTLLLLPVFMLTNWLPNCFFNDAWYCIYYFHPPFMDLLFAALVLLPCLPPGHWWAARAALLVALSIFVHAAAVDLLVGTRGTLMIPGVDSIFLNVFPVAVAATLVTAIVTSWVSGRRPRPRLWGLCLATGTTVGLSFLLSDVFPVPYAVANWTGQPWLLWHLGMCVTLYLGTRSATPAET